MIPNRRYCPYTEVVSIIYGTTNPEHNNGCRLVKECFCNLSLKFSNVVSTRQDGVPLFTNTSEPPLALFRDNILIAHFDNIVVNL